MTDIAGYILCTTPRSGSTLLCSLLSDTGVAGHPESYFHTPDRADWATNLGLPVDSDLDLIISKTKAKARGKSPLFGLRLQYQSLPYFSAQLAARYPNLPNDHARISGAFGRTAFIYLSRDNTLDQAISRVIAQQSGLWHRNADGSERERLSAPHAVQYDRSAIATELAQLTAAKQGWQRWFAAQDITPLSDGYDALSADPRGTVGRILAALGQDPAQADTLCPPTAKLATATNAEWAARFAADPSR